MKKTAVVLFLLAVGFLVFLPKVSEATPPISMNSAGESYAFWHDKAFYTSDTSIIVRVYVVPASGVTMIPTGTKSMQIPTYFAMMVEGMQYSSAVSVIDDPLPHILYVMQEDDYEKIAGRLLPVEFHVYGRQIKTEIRFAPFPEK